MSAQIIIPARLASTRLPRKMLLEARGKTLIQYTYEAALGATRARGVMVATDAEDIRREVERFGGQCVMTSSELRSGTDRVAQAAKELEPADIIVNVQGDEPEMAGTSIDVVIRLLEENPEAVMSTVATPIRTREQLENPACVKVVSDNAGRAMYFSRSVIPHPRDWDDSLLSADPPHFYQHLGLYAYRRDFLFELAQMAPGRTEQVESLEQLRVLEAGHAILVGIVPRGSSGIDTPADFEAFVERLSTR